MNGRIKWIDNARALSIIWIVAFWHIDDYLPIDYNTSLGNYITLGCLATFSYISGCCLGGKRVCDIKDWITFYKSRVIRLYPLYLLSCLLLYLLHIYLNINYIHSTKEFIFSLFGVAAIFPPMPSTIWYVNCVLIYYFITPVIICQKKLSVRILVAGVVYLLIWILVSYGNADERLLFYFIFYLLGIFLGNKEKKINRVNAVALLVASVVLVLGMNVFQQYQTTNWGEGIVVSAVLVVVMQIGRLCSLGRRVSKFFYFISYGSMCTYLFHRVFLGGIFYYFANIPVWIAYVLLLPILAILSYYIQKGYDRILDIILKR